MENKYDDIINLEHHVSKKHPQMSMYSRAAQFASFAALTGYEEAVEETARITSNKIELEEEEKANINKIINEIYKNISNHPKVIITYFVPDAKKQGGQYITVSKKVRKVDEDRKIIILENGEEIPILNISNIVK